MLGVVAPHRVDGIFVVQFVGLYHIAHNLLRDHFRRPELARGEEEPDELHDEDAIDPVRRYDSQQKLQRFLRLLQALPDAQRQVFLLKEEAGLSLEEISQVTGASFETVKSRLRYAVRKLRQAVEDAA